MCRCCPANLLWRAGRSGSAHRLTPSRSRSTGTYPQPTVDGNALSRSESDSHSRCADGNARTHGHANADGNAYTEGHSDIHADDHAHT